MILPVKAISDTYTDTLANDDKIDSISDVEIHTDGRAYLPHRGPIFQSNYSTRAEDIVFRGNYAYIANYTGLEIIDISNPANPTYVGFCSTHLNQANDVDIAGNYAYVLDRDGYVNIIDVSTPSNPTLEYYDFHDYAKGLAIDGDDLYTSHSNAAIPGLQVFQGASTPSTFDDTVDGSHDWFSGGDDAGWDIMVYPGMYAYVAAPAGGLGFQQVVIEDPTNPTQFIASPAEVWNCSTSGATYNIWVNVTGAWLPEYAYLTSDYYLDVVFLGSASVALEGSSDHAPTGIHHNGLIEHNNIVYVASSYYGKSSLLMYDVADKTNPTLTSYIYEISDDYGTTVRLNEDYIYMCARDVLSIYKDIGYTGYTSEYRSNAFLQSTVIADVYKYNYTSATMTVTDSQPSDSSINYYLSPDNGLNWEAVTPGVEHTFSNSGSELKWKAVFSASSDNTSTPYLDSISIDYDAKLIDPPPLQTPEDNAVLTDTTPTFRWGRTVLSVTSYQLQIDTDSTFSSGSLRIYDGVGTYDIFNSNYYYTILTALAEGTWYWRVAGIDSGGDLGPWSPYRTLHIDTTQPTIDSPSSVYYAEETTGHSILWSPSDNNPYYYNITRDGVDVLNGPWDGSTISIDIDGLSYGTYTYICSVKDENELSNSDTVIVNVYDGTNPFINDPSDIVYEETTTGHKVTWITNDLNPYWYNITIDGILDEQGPWNGSNIEYSVDGLFLGTYQINCSVYDVDWNKNSSVVQITVEDTLGPIIDDVSDFEYEFGTINNEITWNPSDPNPYYYNITCDGIDVQNGPWDGSAISIDIDGHVLGDYLYICTVYDIYGLSATDSALVTVVDDTIPTIDHPNDISYENQTTGHIITWTPSDSHPEAYNITVNGLVVDSDPWDGSPITLDLDSLDLIAGAYTIICYVNDTESNSVNDLIYLTIFITPPMVSSPDDQTFKEGSTGYSITWDVADINPYNYTIYQNGTAIQSDFWTNGSTIFLYLDILNLEQNIHNFTIVVRDTDGLIIKDEVMIFVMSPAVAPILNEPEDFNISPGQSFDVVWSMQDDNPVYAEGWLDYGNGTNTLIGTLNWNSGDWPYSGHVFMNMTSMDLGTYNFTVLIQDDDGLISIDTVFVTIIDLTVPTIDDPADVTYIEGEIVSNIIWNPSDDHPSYYKIWENTTLVQEDEWYGDSLPIGISGLSPGIYIYNCTVYDISNNYISSLVIVTVEASIVPVIIGPGAMVVNFMSDTSILWYVTDDNPSEYEIYRDGGLIRDDNLVTADNLEIAENLASLDYGTYTYVLKVTDHHGNIVYNTIEVTITDLSPPVIMNTPLDMTFDENSSNNYIRYYPSDIQDDHPSYVEIYCDGVYKQQLTWDGINQIAYSVDFIKYGEHTLNFTFYDTYGNMVSDTVQVTVQDTTPPNITPISDFSFNEGETSILSSWTPSDNNPDIYVIKRNGVEIADGEWNSSLPIYIPIIDLEAGVYEFYCIVYDKAGNQAYSSVIVTVLSNTVNININSPSDQYSEDQEYWSSIVWTVTCEASPLHYLINKDGTEVVASGEWRADPVEYYFGPLNNGEYEYTITVYDDKGNEASDTVIITVNYESGEDGPSFELISTIITLGTMFFIKKRNKRLKK